MWSKLPKPLVNRMLASHLWLGLGVSALLFIISVSGTLIVFHQEFKRWEQPQIEEMLSVQPAAVQRAAQTALDRESEDQHHLFMGMPGEDFPRLTVNTDNNHWYASSNGELLAPIEHDFAEFLEKLHYYLTLPNSAGLIVVGLLGTAMLALILSGVLAHPRLFRDAFRLRLRGNRQLRETDLHNRLSVWGLPFHITIALTGAALGLATLLAVAVTPAFPDQTPLTFFEPIFGAESDGDEQAAPLADIEAAMSNFSAEHPELEPWYVSFHHPATVGQDGNVLARHPDRLIYGDNYYFDADGDLTYTTGLSDGAFGKQLVASLYPLHFGSFGGLTVRLIYGILGLALCVIIASGTNIWLHKREQKGKPSKALRAVWTATIWGTPLLCAWVLALAVFGVGLTILIATFWLGLVALWLLAVPLARSDYRPLRSGLQALTALGLVLALGGHVTQFGVSSAFVAYLNLSLVLAAIGLLALAAYSRKAANRQAR